MKSPCETCKEYPCTSDSCDALEKWLNTFPECRLNSLPRERMQHEENTTAVETPWLTSYWYDDKKELDWLYERKLITKRDERCYLLYRHGRYKKWKPLKHWQIGKIYKLTAQRVSQIVKRVGQLKSKLHDRIWYEMNEKQP